MNEQFSRNEMLLGKEALLRLAAAHVAVLGLGGVGGYAVEALARAGVGELTLIDHDTISETNLNRQIGALHSTIGLSKAEVLATRVLDINPAAVIHPHCKYYSAETREVLFGPRYDYIIDAIDLVSCKLDLISQAYNRDVPIISALGTGNKLDPSQFLITDISKTYNCPLARVIRKELRYRGILHHTVLFSPEEPIEARQLETPPPGRRSIPGSVPWVPGCAGLMLGGFVVMKLVSGEVPPPASVISSSK